MSLRFVAPVVALASLLFAVPAAATEDPPEYPDCSTRIDLDADVAVELHVGDHPCRPVPDGPCTINGVPGRFNRFGRCICIPPTTTTIPPTTLPPVTVPGPPGPAGPQGPAGETVVIEVERVVEVPVVERVAPAATPVRSAPRFTG